jgi:hypothetical protein
MKIILYPLRIDIDRVYSGSVHALIYMCLCVYMCVRIVPADESLMKMSVACVSYTTVGVRLVH